MATKKKKAASKPRTRVKAAPLAPLEPMSPTPSPYAQAASAPKSSFGLRAILLVALFAFVGWKLATRVRTEPITGELKNAIASMGGAPEQVVGCRTLTVDKDGNVFYYFVGRLKKFSPEGKLLAFPVGKGKPEQMYPYMTLWALAPDQKGGVWGADRGASGLLHFDEKLRMDHSIKTNDTNLTGLTIDSQGRFIVASDGPYVQVLDPDGKPLFKVGFGGKSPLGAAYRVTVDEQDNIYVLDRANCTGKPLEDPTIRSYDKTGKALAHWKATGLAWNEFSCIAYDPQGYIALNNSGLGTMAGIVLYTKKGDARFQMAAANGVNVGSTTGMAISSNGDLIVDNSPNGRGCDRLGLPALDLKDGK